MILVRACLRTAVPAAVIPFVLSCAPSESDVPAEQEPAGDNLTPRHLQEAHAGVRFTRAFACELTILKASLASGTHGTPHGQP